MTGSTYSPAKAKKHWSICTVHILASCTALSPNSLYQFSCCLLQRCWAPSTAPATSTAWASGTPASTAPPLRRALTSSAAARPHTSTAAPSGTRSYRPRWKGKKSLHLLFTFIYNSDDQISIALSNRGIIVCFLFLFCVNYFIWKFSLHWFPVSG
jgi:hypothetical protein